MWEEDMMAEEKKTVSRKKPKFLRTDWHKKIRLGRGLKKKQKWHGAKGRQNKLRLGRKGRMQRPKIGWGAERDGKENFVRVENVKELAEVKKGYGIVIGSVGMKKRKEIIAKANEMKVKVLNKYKEEGK
jgi:ribosomal protein L32E